MSYQKNNSPTSPRMSRNNRQIWNDCNIGPSHINSDEHYSPGSPASISKNYQQSQQPANRKIKPLNNVSCYESGSSKNSPNSSYPNPNNSKKNNKFTYEPPRSPKITTTFTNDDGEIVHRNCENEDDEVSMNTYHQTLQRSKPEKKFVFDAISPSYEYKGKQFEYYEPKSPDQTIVDTFVDPPSGIPPNPYKPKLASTDKRRIDDANNEMSKVHSGRNRYKPLDELSSVTKRNLFLKRDSSVTESTEHSVDSCDTNCTAITTTTPLSNKTPSSFDRLLSNKIEPGQSQSDNNNTILITNNCLSGNKIEKNLVSGKRRHAINITSNPGYKALHGSHSTLDRTCSDSVVTFRCRKSTSDLTKLDGNDGSAPALVSKSFRRRSSKGGLAYLVSRRNSRDSIKSAGSKTSVFSNEDVGPLTFQASARGRQRRTSNFLELPIPDHIRPRVCSLPDRPYNPRNNDDLYRLRHFSISKGNVVNCGDSIISRRSRSNTSVNSTTSRASERSPFDGSCCGGGYANVDSMPPSPSESEDPPPPPRYRIVMLGDAGVGKTALVSQFMTSEYMHTYDASLDDEFGEKTVSILLDDEESELVFIDHPSIEMSVENSLSTYEPHACVIVYSIVDRNSFKIAEDVINYLWKENITKDKAVILVGNKADLARSRTISTTDGKNLAGTRDVKFIETSSGIQHNVDELLVGALKQIRLKEKRDKKKITKMRTSRTHISLHLAKELLQKICLTDITKSKSCENLHVL